MKINNFGLAICLAIPVQLAAASEVSISISGVNSIYPTSDTIDLRFDDSYGGAAVPYWLNGFASGSAQVGYTGTLYSRNSSYVAPVYIGFASNHYFNIFQECSLTVKCYLADVGPTNLVMSTIDPLQPGNLDAFLRENLENLTTFAGPNSGWNVSYNTPPSFPETWPWLQVVKPSNIVVSSVPEPSSSYLLLAGLLVLVAATFRRSQVKFHQA